MAVTLRRTLGWSTRRIGNTLGVSHPTVLGDLSAGRNLPADLPDRITGIDSKSYPARKPSVIAKTMGEQQQILGALDQMDIETGSDPTRARMATRRR